MTPKASNKNRVKLYADPDTTFYLKSEWLKLGTFESISVLPRVLSQLGLQGNVTAFLSLKNEITFIHDMKTALTLHFFTSNEVKNSDLTTCIIPNYKTNYDKGYATVENNSWTFYTMNDLSFNISPCFITKRYINGCTCHELNKENIKFSFSVDKPFGEKVGLTVIIKNKAENIKLLDDFSTQILHILEEDNPKNIYSKYEEIKKQIASVSSYYDLYHTTEDGSILDELLVENNKTKMFMLSTNSQKITLNDDHSWTMTSPAISISCKGDDIDVEAHINKSELSKFNSLYDIYESVKLFIKENMWFAFEG